MLDYMDYVLAHLSEPVFIVVAVLLLGLLVLLGITIQLVSSYLSSLGLAKMFEKKKFTLKSLLSEWRGVVAWTGT